jgi:hypothetical protein
LYSVVTKDVSGTTISKTIFLEKPSGFTTYSVSIQTTNSQSISSPSLNVFDYTSTIVVNPELPSGVSLTFDVRHLNTTSNSPSLTACTATTTSQLEINSVLSGMSYSSTTTGETFNPTPGCQGETKYISSLTEVWNNVIYKLGDDFILSTTTSILKNIDINCYIGTSTDSFTISNLRISGCDCCKAVVT